MANDEVKTTTPETVDVTIREPIKKSFFGYISF